MKTFYTTTLLELLLLIKSDSTNQSTLTISKKSGISRYQEKKSMSDSHCRSPTCLQTNGLFLSKEEKLKQPSLVMKA